MLEQVNAAWVAMGMVAVSVVTAWQMNAGAPQVRAFGTLLAAFGCSAAVLWFAVILGTGILENPKPNQTPMDSAKPALLWGMAGTSLIATLLLVRASILQFRSAEPLTLPAKNEPERYGMTSRILHWTIAILFIALIPMGIFASMIPEGTWFRNHYYVAHKSIGVLVLLLLLIRLFWNQRSKRPELDSSLKPSERKWAHRVHIMLYVLLLAMPITGYVMTSFHGYPTFFFGLEIAPLWGESDAYIVWGLFHKYLLPYVLYIVLGAHILGALKHYFIDRHPAALKRMVG